MTQIQINTDALNSARNFLTGSVEDGTAIHDTVIKPMALLVHIFQEQAAKTKAYLSVAEAQKLRDTLGEEYDEVIDSILSNWFVERKDGDPPKINVRLFFSSPPEILQFGRDTKICTFEGITFYPQESQTVFSTDFVGHLNPLGGTEKYSIDMALVGGGPAALTRNIYVTTPSFSVASNKFLYGEVRSVLNFGTIKEDTDVFIQRAQKAITTRELITDRAISTVLSDSVDEVEDIYIAGYGAQEQIRDLHTFGGVTVHTGNKSDIYVKTTLERVTVNYLIDDSGLIDLSGRDILRIFKVTDSEGVEQVFSISGSSESKVNSLHNSWFLSVPAMPHWSIVTVELVRAVSLQVADTYLNHPERRVTCYDPLVKEMYPIYMTGDVYIRIVPGAFIGLNEQSILTGVRDTAINYINALGSSDIFRVSSFISHLHEKHSEIDQIETPMSWNYEILNPADLSIVTGTTTSRFNLPSGLSEQVTNNTTQYYTDASLLNVYHNG